MGFFRKRKEPQVIVGTSNPSLDQELIRICNQFNLMGVRSLHLTFTDTKDPQSSTMDITTTFASGWTSKIISTFKLENKTV